MISLNITAETPEELLRNLRGLCGGIPQEAAPAAPETPVTHPAQDAPAVQPMADIIEKARGAKKQETAPESPAVPAPQGSIPPEALPPQPPVISEAQAVELRVLCEKFCAQDPEGKKKIQRFLKDHDVPRITEMPTALVDEFKAAVAV